MLTQSESEPATQPQRICELCVEHLSVTGAGISIVTQAGNRGVIYVTDEVSADIEDLQFTLGEGPCVDAVATGAPVLIPDLAEADLDTGRWPAFMKGAENAGVKAVFAFPLRIGAISLGALDLYRDEVGDLAKDELPAIMMAAHSAAVALLHLDAAGNETFMDELIGRSSYQLQVHQATGMVQVQMGVGTNEAFLLLRARAFAEGRKLTEVATDVVERRLRFTKEDQ